MSLQLAVIIIKKKNKKKKKVDFKRKLGSGEDVEEGEALI